VILIQAKQDAAMPSNGGNEPTARVRPMSQMWVTSMGERRASPRQRRLNGAKIVFNNNSSVIDCIVRDLSSQGARLLVTSPVGIPDRFDLRIDRNGACHPSQVTWRANDQIGVSFSAFLGDQPSALLPQYPTAS
jgi:hypothetical protein